MNIIDLGKVIDPEVFQIYVDEAEKLETVVHKYGSDFIIPDYPCWMEYKNESNIYGSISFSRHTSKHPVLAEMAQKIYDACRTIFLPKVPLYLDRVHFIRTMGNIPIHRDEANRNACINIGIKNSSGAMTKISTNGLRYDNDTNYSTMNLCDGHAYLMNTHAFHSVEHTNNNPRYLITHGFNVDYSIIKSYVKE